MSQVHDANTILKAYGHDQRRYAQSIYSKTMTNLEQEEHHHPSFSHRRQEKSAFYQMFQTVSAAQRALAVVREALDAYLEAHDHEYAGCQVCFLPPLFHRYVQPQTLTIRVNPFFFLVVIGGEEGLVCPVFLKTQQQLSNEQVINYITKLYSVPAQNLDQDKLVNMLKL